MESSSFVTGTVCSGCGSAATAGARFCRGCGTQLAETAEPAFSGGSRAAAQAGAQAKAVGDELGRRVSKAWATREARPPLIALALTLIGVFLPWAGKFSLSSLVGWELPTMVAAVIALSIIFYVTLPGRPGWLGVVVSGASFAIAVLASVVMALLLVVAHVANLLVGAVSSADSFLGGSSGPVAPHVSLSLGGWVTAAAAIVLFITALQLTLSRREPA